MSYLKSIISTQEKRIAELEADKARLDWIEAQLFSTFRLSIDFTPSVFVCYGGGEYRGTKVAIDVRGKSIIHADTLREAIDAARKES